MKAPLFIIIGFTSLFACTLKTREPSLNLTITNSQEELNTYLSDNLSEILEENNFANKNWIEKLYSKNNYNSIWLDDSLHLNKNGDSLLKIIYHSNYYGLNAKNYKIENLARFRNLLSENSIIKDAALFEILLSDSYMLFGKHLNYGRVDSIKAYTNIERKKFLIDMPSYLSDAVVKNNVLEKLFELQPKHVGYVLLQKALEKYLKKHSTSDKAIVVPSYKLDSLRSYNNARTSLIIHQYLNKNSTDNSFENSLKKFQNDHGLTPDAIVGKNTAAALSLSPLEYYQNAAISLERWRWKKEWETSYIYINIPASYLEYYRNDTLQIASKIVVGSVRNRTPEIYSKLSYLVVYPFWHVPKSISVNEILVHAKQDSSYMYRNNYEIFSNRMKKIPLDSIEWDTIDRQNYNYYIRQKGGYSNSLGLVKFIFHSKYAIYLHDTPSKHFFYNDIRTFSHGCIRVQKAMQLADTLLKSEDNPFTLDSINAYILKTEEKKVMFKNKLPIYIQYITCAAGNNGSLIFYKDIYGYDDRIRKEFSEHTSR